MRNTKLLIVVACILSICLLAACGKKEEQPAGEPEGAATSLKEAVKQVEETATEVVEQTPETYLNEVKVKLDNFDTQVAELEAKAEKLADPAKAAVAEPLKELNAKKAEAHALYENLQTAPAEEWEENTAKMNDAIKGCEETFSKVSSLL